MRRLILFSASVPLGLAIGLVAWLAAGGATANNEALSPIEHRVASLKTPRSPVVSPYQTRLADLTSSPLFALTVGSSAVSEPTVHVVGISVTRRRAAALIEINGGSAQWLQVGDNRDGLTVQAVSPSAVSIETALGPKEISLGQTVAGTGTPPMASNLQVNPALAPPAVVGPDHMPPGFRSPPAPASAPRASQ